jgi:hypothetical protein
MLVSDPRPKNKRREEGTKEGKERRRMVRKGEERRVRRGKEGRKEERKEGSAVLIVGATVISEDRHNHFHFVEATETGGIRSPNQRGGGRGELRGPSQTHHAH